MGLFGRRERGGSALPEPAATLAAHGVRVPAPLEPLQAAADLTVWSVPVEGEAAGLDLWTAARDVHPATGLWPVLAVATTWDSVAASFDEQPGQVNEHDAGEWVAARRAADPDEFPRGRAEPFAPTAPTAWRELVASYPEQPDRLLLVPAARGADVPGLLGWQGAVNFDILGDVHTAFLRRFDDLWGAELVVLGFDTVTLRVSRPPTTPESALAVAQELAFYCPDIVHQGVQTLDALVPMAASPAWWFWWD